MGRFLNIGMMQMPIDTERKRNLELISRNVDHLMSGYLEPEMIIGVECGINIFKPEPIPGPSTEFLQEIARKYHIYFIPGTIAESRIGNENGRYYNSAPIIDPDGNLLAVYRKIAPWYPSEDSVPGDEYTVFDIPQKKTRIGVEICYDMNFPEISRNLTLMGAEVIVKLAADPERLFEPYRHMTSVRALENQVYFVSTNGTGNFMGSSLYGHSSICDPEGAKIWEAGREPCCCTVTLDLERVITTRECGAFFMDQNLNLLRQLNLPMPFADDIGKAPVFNGLDLPATSVKAFQRKLKKFGVGTIRDLPSQN